MQAAQRRLAALLDDLEVAHVAQPGDLVVQPDHHVRRGQHRRQCPIAAAALDGEQHRHVEIAHQRREASEEAPRGAVVGQQIPEPLDAIDEHQARPRLANDPHERRCGRVRIGAEQRLQGEQGHRGANLRCVEEGKRPQMRQQLDVAFREGREHERGLAPGHAREHDLAAQNGFAGTGGAHQGHQRLAAQPAAEDPIEPRDPGGQEEGRLCHRRSCIRAGRGACQR